MHIAIAGNIGSGKTTLTQLLAKHYGYQGLYESADENPYINSFYEDMRRWSFNLQIHNLHTRFRQLLDIKRTGLSFIQDRTLEEDAFIYAPNLQSMGLLNSRDYDNYIALFNLLTSFVEPPDMLVYLRADVPSLIRNILRRGREYETSISLDYLTSLNTRYDEWIDKMANDIEDGLITKTKLLIVDIEDINFADNPEDLGTVINQIDAEFNGLF